MVVASSVCLWNQHISLPPTIPSGWKEEIPKSGWSCGFWFRYHISSDVYRTYLHRHLNSQTCCTMPICFWCLVNIYIHRSTQNVKIFSSSTKWVVDALSRVAWIMLREADIIYVYIPYSFAVMYLYFWGYRISSKGECDGLAHDELWKKSCLINPHRVNVWYMYMFVNVWHIYI